MPRDGAIVFGDLIGKLDMLQVSSYDKCGLCDLDTLRAIGFLSRQ
jgi:hypothetical protein